nr:glucose 1-dehydrogenase [Flexivirga meconopsidis]
MNRLSGKRALITGATGGIGSATASQFAMEGAAVLVTDHDRERVDALVETLAADGLDVDGAALDVTDPAQWERAVAQAVSAFGGLDTLINVAGIVAWEGIETTEQTDWDRVVAVNLTGTWLGMKAAMPALLTSDTASIVNTSSVLGIIGGGGAAAYHATKGAVRLLSKTAAVEYAERGVRVNSVHPGVISTPMISEILQAEGDQQADIQRTPMKRAGSAEEVAAGIVYLASDESSFMTGAELVIDGGLTAH